MKRQAFIAGVAAAPFIAKAALADPTTLKSAAASAGIIYGANVRDLALVQKYPDLASLMIQQCAIVESGRDFQMARTQPNSQAFDFSATDAWMSWVASNGLKSAACHLVWYQALPGWLKKDAQNTHDVMTNHVSTLVGRYAGKMYSWVVVNEAIKISEGRPDGLRDNVWLQNIGPSYIDDAFRAAAAADPHAILLYNDGGFEYDDLPSASAHRTAILNLLRGMLSRGVPIHAFLSELDVADGHYADLDDTTRDATTAKEYSGYFSTALANKSITTVINWSLADKYSWLNKWDPDKGGSSNGKLLRGLPFGFNLEPTPIFNTMVDAFQNAPKR
jgi:endo-1,4-beta-xylanase